MVLEGYKTPRNFSSLLLTTKKMNHAKKMQNVSKGQKFLRNDSIFKEFEIFFYNKTAKSTYDPLFSTIIVSQGV